MIGGIIESIEHTKIFSSVVYPAKIEIRGNKKVKIPEGNPLQLIIYSTHINFYKKNDELDVPGSKVHPNLLILPFPLVSGSNRIKILNMKQYENFFDDVEMIFPTPTDDTFKGSLYKNLDLDETVTYSQNYRTFVLQNFQILFNRPEIPIDLKDFAGRYYKQNYGFIMVIIYDNYPLAPFAYVHELRDQKLYIPLKSFYRTLGFNPYSATKSTEIVNPYYDCTKDFYNEVKENNKNNCDETIDNDIHLMKEIESTNSFLYKTLMIDDEWLKINAKKKDLKSFKDQSNIIWDHEIYIVNFPRILKNALLKKNGIKIINGDLNRLVNFYTYIENPKLPLEIALIKPKHLFKIKIDGNHKYNYDLFL